MDTVRRVAKNTGVILVGKIINGSIGLVTVIFLARYLGPGSFGIYSFIFAYLGFFVIITDLGISLILIREISRDRAKGDRFIGNAIIIKIILSLFAFGLACLIISFLHYPFNTKLLIYIASLSFLLSFRSLYGLIFQVNLRMEYPLLVSIATNLLRLVLFLYLDLSVHQKNSKLCLNILCLLGHEPERHYHKPAYHETIRLLYVKQWPGHVLYLNAEKLLAYNYLVVLSNIKPDGVGVDKYTLSLPQVHVLRQLFQLICFPFLLIYNIILTCSMKKNLRPIPLG